MARAWLTIVTWTATVLVSLLGVTTSSFAIAAIHGKQDLATTDPRLTNTVRGVSYATVVAASLAILTASVWATLRQMED